MELDKRDPGNIAIAKALKELKELSEK